jgi:act minimal PKS ketosynthase (KS/KS alpha)
MSARNAGRRRAVITGVGVVAPGGIGTKAFWSMLADGRSATRAISRFDASGYNSRVAGECDFDPCREGLSRQEFLRLDRAAQFAVTAAREAVGSSGLDAARMDPRRIAVAIGCAVGGKPEHDRPGERYQQDQYQQDQYQRNRRCHAMAAELGLLVEAAGPMDAVSTGCTSGIDAVGHAAALITEGSADVVITGGAEAPLSPLTVICFDVIGVSTTRNDDPAGACRPFDRTRDGIVLAEGAAILVVEELRHAWQRGAHIYAEIAGFSSRRNVYHMTNLDPDGKELAAAIDSALRQAQLDRSGVDYLNAHGAATLADDVYETQAFKRCLGHHAYATPVSGTKSMIGHSLAAAGALEIAGCLLAFEENVIPPTANLHEADPRCDLDYVPLVARERRVNTVLTANSGFEGFQSAMALRRLGSAVR